jgi:hypothetical protein
MGCTYSSMDIILLEYFWNSLNLAWERFKFLKPNVYLKWKSHELHIVIISHCGEDRYFNDCLFESNIISDALN